MRNGNGMGKGRGRALRKTVSIRGGHVVSSFAGCAVTGSSGCTLIARWTESGYFALGLHGPTVDGKNPANLLIWRIYHYSQGFIHPKWCRISSINSRNPVIFSENDQYVQSLLSIVFRFHSSSEGDWIPRVEYHYLEDHARNNKWLITK